MKNSNHPFFFVVSRLVSHVVFLFTNHISNKQSLFGPRFQAPAFYQEMGPLYQDAWIGKLLIGSQDLDHEKPEKRPWVFCSSSLGKCLPRYFLKKGQPDDLVRQLDLCSDTMATSKSEFAHVKVKETISKFCAEF